MSDVQKALKRGAFVNFWGVLGKLAAPAFLIVVNRFYGSDVFGYFITASMILDIALAFLTFGFKDGILIHVSKYADRPYTQPRMYNSVANALIWPLIVVALFIFLMHLFGGNILQLAYQEPFANSLFHILGIIVWAMPFMVFDRIVVASTQGLKIMKYDAIVNGGLRQISLLLFATLFWYISPDISGLAFAFLAAQGIVFIVAAFIFTIEFNWNNLLSGLQTFSVDKQLIDFALPQNLNMTLNRFITGVDILMLPLFGISAKMVGYYGAGAMIVREVRNIKLIFSSAFAPHIVRLFEDQKFSELSHHFSRTSAWVTSLVIPVLLTILIFREELLLLVQPDFDASTLFMVCLLPVPYLYSAFSLAGNILTMTGHSKITLFNTLAASIINVLLNIWMIPVWQLAGAATASAVTMLCLSVLELIEAKSFSRARLYIKDVASPHGAGLLALSVLLISIHTGLLNFFSPILGKILLLFIVLLSFAGGLLLFDKILNRQTVLTGLSTD